MRELIPILSQAVALQKAGKLAEAERLCRKIARRDRYYGEALRLRGLIARQQGDAQKSIKLIRRAIEHNPTNAAFHHTLAQLLRAAGHYQQAITSYRRAWTLLPERNATGEDLARCQAQAGHVDDAIATWRQLLPRSSDAAAIHTHIAKLQYEHGHVAAALATLNAWQAQGIDNGHDWYQLGRAWISIRQTEQAIACYRTAVDANPDHAEACAGLGSALQLQGQTDEGATWLEKALRLKPELGWAYPALVGIRHHQLSPHARTSLQQLAQDTHVPEPERVYMQFALGTLLDREREHEQAFRHYQAGNRIHAQRQPFDPAAFVTRIERMLRQFDTQFFAQRANFGIHSQRPVFIVGMPRSGTSLVEQIIASHPQAYGAGELDDMGAMVRELPAITDAEKRFPETVAKLDAGQAETLAHRYLASLTTRDDTATRVTDKMPLNLLWLGFIALLFPQARVVYCRRDALDNCLSCYFQIFHSGLRFSYDLEHLGGVYRQHERLMAHWQQCLPLDMMTVDYETLVANQETESHRLIEFAGLPWDDRCLSFHETKRAVQTASTWQVRQPMYNSSVERWRAYEPWLEPLLRSLDSGQSRS